MSVSVLRYSFANLLLFLNCLLLLIGGKTLLAGFVLVLSLSTFIDEIFGDTDEEEVAGPPAFLDLMVWLTLPLVALNSLLFAFYVAPAEHTWMGAALSRIGLDFDASRRNTTWLEIFAAGNTIGIFYGWAMNACHEFSHRTTEPLKQLGARWLGAFSCESAFLLQHLTGHHINIGIYEDSGTSRRGESIYAFVLRASIGNNRFAFNAEKERLERRGLPVWSHHNRFLRGQLMTVAIAIAFYFCGGWPAIGAFFALGLLGRFYLEAAAYVEHYGLVRVPGTRYEARHSWNSYRALSNGLLYNVARHAHHHLAASKPYYKLVRDEGAPILPHGYVTLFVFALIPPLFNYVMRPVIADWDMNYATDAERRYIVEKGKELWLPAPAE